MGYIRGIVLFMAIISLWSCHDDSLTTRDLLPRAVGKTGELLVVMDEQLWNSTCGEMIRDSIGQAYQVLNQYETHFDIEYRSFEDFGKFFKPFRTVIIADIADNVSNQQTRTEQVKERYAKDQLIFHIHARDCNAFEDEWSLHAGQIMGIIEQKEIRRIQQQVRARNNPEISQRLQAQYALTLDLHRGFTLMEQRPDFIWMRRDQQRPKDGQKHEIEQGIMIYTYPYVSDSTFTKEFLLQKRDSVMKANVPGGPEGSYMTTEYFYEPVFEPSVLNGEYCAILRGLWTVKGDFMGGPFVSITTFDKLNNRIVTAEGYVYAPNFDKREYIRELEAVLYSLKFISPAK